MANIDPTAIVKTNEIGENTNVWQFAVILEGARVGENCNICSHAYIEYGVIIGNNVTIKFGVHLCEGNSIEDDVFIGPNVTFTNDAHPRSKKPMDKELTRVGKGASIGAAAVILPGIDIGPYGLIGAGAVVTKDTQPFGLYYGNPAELHGYVTKDGNILSDELKDSNGIQYEWKNNDLIPT